MVGVEFFVITWRNQNLDENDHSGDTAGDSSVQLVSDKHVLIIDIHGNLTALQLG